MSGASPRQVRRTGFLRRFALLACVGSVAFWPRPVRAELERDRGTATPHRKQMPVSPPKAPAPAKPRPPKEGGAVEAAPEAPTKPHDEAVKAEQAEDRGGWVAVPLLVYSPETHFGFGGFGVHYFRFGGESNDTRVSSIAAVALATTRRQLILELLPELYWDQDGFHIDGKVEYQYFPDNFWGIGDSTPNGALERYLRERVRTRGIGRRRLFGPIYLGLHWDVMGFFPTYRDTTGVFATTNVPGKAGGLTSGVGPTAQYDTRDNTVESRSGTLISVTYDRFDAVFGSQYEFNKFVLDVRHFIPLGLTHALGLRFYGEANGGNVPYYLMAMMGGDELLRGYYLGRYRDKWLGAAEAEYRFPIVWLFRGVLFAGVAEVADSPKHIDLDPIRWTAGTGLRLTLSKKERLNLRFDFGIGANTYGFYLSASEAF
jgi:hypothetical protein